MAYEQKPGQGSLFKNDKKGNENAPDYNGTANIDGTTYRLSGWIKEGKSGKWMSLKVEFPRPKAANTGTTRMSDIDPDADIEF